MSTYLTHREPKTFFVSEKDRREAYEFIRETLDTIVGGRFDVDYIKLKVAYEKIDRPCSCIIHDLIVLKKIRRREAQLATMSEAEAKEALADMKAIERQIEETRELIREMQHKRIEALRKYESWDSVESSIRQDKRDKPHLFADVDELSKGGGMSEEQTASYSIVDEIREALR